MLAQSFRQWANIKPTVAQCLVLVAYYDVLTSDIDCVIEPIMKVLRDQNT